MLNHILLDHILLESAFYQSEAKYLILSNLNPTRISNGSSLFTKWWTKLRAKETVRRRLAEDWWLCQSRWWSETAVHTSHVGLRYIRRGDVLTERLPDTTRITSDQMTVDTVVPVRRSTPTRHRNILAPVITTPQWLSAIGRKDAQFLHLQLLKFSVTTPLISFKKCFGAHKHLLRSPKLMYSSLISDFPL